MDLVEEFQHNPDLSPISFVNSEFEDTHMTFWDLNDHSDILIPFLLMTIPTNSYGRLTAAVLPFGRVY